MLDVQKTRAFIREHTQLTSAAIVPEVKLHLATEIMPLWHATAEVLERYKLESPFWAFAWPGGQAIARTVLDAPELVRGKRVLDFATGSGLCAIAACLSGAAHVLATDTDPFVLAAAKLNAEANNVDFDVTTDDLLGAPLQDIDVVLAGDIFYERPLAERGLAWFRELHTRGIKILVGDPGRIYSPKDVFKTRARYQVPTSLELEDKPIRDTAVLEL